MGQPERRVPLKQAIAFRLEGCPWDEGRDFRRNGMGFRLGLPLGVAGLN
jgi:hypothetical protein